MVQAVRDRHHGRAVRTLAVGMAAALLTLTACTTQAPGATNAARAPVKALTVGATLEPQTMDPSATPAASVPQAMLYNVYETLVKMDADGRLRPLLAQEWEQSTDRLTYTFRLNPAATFASGKPVTAAAVVTSFDRAKSSGVAAPIQAVMSVVKSTEAVDDHTVRVTLTHPSNLWLQDISSTAGIVYDPDGLGSLATATAGSGPFQLQKWNRGQSVVLEKNARYWGTPARFDTATFRYFADPNAMNAALLSGEIDIISNLQAPDAIVQFADPGRYSVIEGTTTGEVVMAINNSRPALKNVKVRRAISMAIDKRALVDTVWNGKGTLIGSMAVPTDPWYEDLTGVNPYDPAAAKTLLKEAGQDKGLSLRLRVPTTAYATKSAQFVASALNEVGIKVSVQELDFTTWLNEVHNGGDYDLSIVAHVEARDIRRFTDKNYYFHYDNPEFVEQFTKADQAPEADFVADMKIATRTLAADAAAVWLFDLPNLVVTRAGITGVGQNSAALSFDLTTVASR